MYLQIKKFESKPGSRGGKTYVEHHISLLWLYADWWEFIKWIKQDDVVYNKMLEAQFQVDLPDIQHLLNETDQARILRIQMDEFWPNLFGNMELWALRPTKTS